MENLIKLFKENIKIGEKYTFWKFGEMGFPQTLQCKIEKIEVKPYAQYNKTILIYYKEKGKRKQRGFRLISENSPLIVCDGWVNIVDNMFLTSLKKTETQILSGSQSGLTFSHQYLEIALKSLGKQTPLILIDSYIIPKERDNFYHNIKQEWEK